MPITKSAKKSLRSAKAKFQRNNIIRRNLEIVLKKAKTNSFSAAVSAIDKAARRKVIHKNKAARIKSRLAKKLKPKK